MKKTIVAVLTLISPMSFGAVSIHEIFGGSSAGIFFNNGTRVGVDLGYNYLVVPGVQFGLLSGVAYSKPSGATNGTTAISLLGGPTINFPFSDDISNAVFLFGGAGFVHAASGGTSATEFAFAFSLGKRFEIVSNVCYRPNLGITKVSNVDPTFSITPLEFSFVF